MKHGTIIAATFGLVAAACFDPHYDAPLCGPADVCPGTLVCRNDVCVAADDAGADPIDAPVIDSVVDAALDDAIDAPNIDADTTIDAPGTCPTAYSVVVGGSRYARRTTPSTLTTASVDCNDDLPGRTHLATFESPDLDAVIAVSGAAAADTLYVGGECNTVGPGCDSSTSWIWTVSGSAVNPSLWEAGEPSGGLTRTMTQRTAGSWHLVSSGGMILRSYLCECDP